MSDALKLIKQLAGLEKIEEQAQINEQEVTFLGFNSTNYPLEKAIAAKAFRKGKLIQLSMNPSGKPMAVIDDPESSGQYEAYWNDKVGTWTIDFD